jgi:DNA-directed RNA polymerase specialized sigma subunit
MNSINPEAELPKVQKLIYAMAHKFSSTYPISYEECLSEGYWAFMRACEKFQPDRGMKFSSWVYSRVWYGLKDLVTKRSKDPITFIEIDEDLFGEAPAVKSESLEMIEDLSQDAREIISLLMETPEEIMGGMSATPRQFLKAVKNYLIRKGRCPKQIDAAHQEIRQRFQEVWAV